jgi:hypothetical protein
MNRIVVSPSGFELGAALPDGLDRGVGLGSTFTSNEGPRDRHVERFFFGSGRVEDARDDEEALRGAAEPCR